MPMDIMESSQLLRPIRMTQWHRDPRKHIATDWAAPGLCTLWTNSHQIADSVNFACVYLDFSLPSRAGLRVIDRYPLASNYK